MCDTCGKAFSNKSTLNRHRLLHQESAHQIKINILTRQRAQKHLVGTLTGPKCETEHSKVSLPSMIFDLFNSIKSLRSTKARCKISKCKGFSTLRCNQCRKAFCDDHSTRILSFLLRKQATLNMSTVRKNVISLVEWTKYVGEIFCAPNLAM